MTKMWRKVLSSPMLVLALCLPPATAFANVDACSPTKPKPKNTNVKIPDVGKPRTPASGVANGWVLLYDDSGFTQLSDEVYCSGNRIRFASSDGEKNFQKHPNCKKTTCTKAVETGKVTKVVLKGTSGNTNTFLWSSDFAGFYVFHDFTGPTSDGATPDAPLLRDVAGNLYGTTLLGGVSSSYGTVFKIDTSGKETVLYNFTGGADGGYPYGGLVQDSTGNLYGTTAAGGSTGNGTVFKLDTSNVETVLHSFSGPDGAYPVGGLVRDSSGNFYGTTEIGGSGGNGTVFKLDPTNTLTTLYNFTGGSDGGYPLDETLIIDGSGNLYGTTNLGGSTGNGTVFKLDTSNVETVLHSFAGGSTDGCHAYGDAAMDASGNLYGTTRDCGSGNAGIVWKVDTTGTEVVLYNFSGGADGGSPLAGVILDRSGNLYGVTLGGGAGNAGTLFQVSGTTETVLRSFSPSTDGANPIGGLIFDADGNIYGTANNGGSSNYGTVWGFDLK
jgi:uncharacterized repeat protein (TIGR03803 family)